MANYILHVATENERLDQIAYRYYGDVSLMIKIIDFNPELALIRNYRAGTLVKITIVQERKSSQNLPPWLRG